MNLVTSNRERVSLLKYSTFTSDNETLKYFGNGLV